VDGSDYPRATHINTPAAEIVATQTELGTDVAGSQTDLKTRLANSMSDAGHLDFATSTELTISAGSATVTQNWHTIDTEADASTDDLDTLVATNATDGFVLFVRANNTARTVVIKHNTGNIQTDDGLSITLDETYKTVLMIYDATLSKWLAKQLASVPPGAVVQTVNVQDGAVATGTTTLPWDDTIPQNTEGDQYMSLAITPTSSTNKLKIEVVWNGTISSVTQATLALFQDSTANALAASQGYISSGGQPINMTLIHYMTAGTTSATTFKVRFGAASASTTTFNGSGGARKLGGVMASSITIHEIKV
jgi:hypothetical protein